MEKHSEKEGHRESKEGEGARYLGERGIDRVRLFKKGKEIER